MIRSRDLRELITRAYRSREFQSRETRVTGVWRGPLINNHNVQLTYKIQYTLILR